MANGYETPTHDTDADTWATMPDISSVGFGYPGDFQALMPGYALSAVNVSVDPFIEGTWTTPEAYAWHSADNLTTNPQIGGEAAPMLGVPFSFGAVESSTVENFEMLGNQAVFQTPDVMNWGDVGYLNFGGVLGSSVASGYFDEASYQDLSASIIYGV
jgi:hypothetical protein